LNQLCKTHHRRWHQEAETGLVIKETPANVKELLGLYINEKNQKIKCLVRTNSVIRSSWMQFALIYPLNSKYKVIKVRKGWGASSRISNSWFYTDGKFCSRRTNMPQPKQLTCDETVKRRAANARHNSLPSPKYVKIEHGHTERWYCINFFFIYLSVHAATHSNTW
jgi:hypothetical protein